MAGGIHMPAYLAFGGGTALDFSDNGTAPSLEGRHETPGRGQLFHGPDQFLHGPLPLGLGHLPLFLIDDVFEDHEIVLSRS
jgi:hypothetical protein